LQAAFQATRLFFIRTLSSRNKTEVRLRLRRWLSLTLEFELAADILKTAIAPNWDEISNLRQLLSWALLNYFLERDIRNGDSKGVPASA
jgi:uncharacterized membrane protein